MTIVRYTRNAGKPATLSPDDKARLDAMTDEAITQAAENDPDNPPLTGEDLARFRAARVAKTARERAALSQARFAETFTISLGRLRDIEQGRGTPDPVLVSLLTLIGDDPKRAERLLSKHEAA